MRLYLASFHVLLLAATCFSAAPWAAAQSVSTPAGAGAEWAARVDPLVEAEIERRSLVGAAVGIIDDGRVAYLQGYGYEDREAGEPVTLATRFRWASISKTLTAVAAMQLVEQGMLDLDRNVRDYVPEFPNKGATITARQLLCHQAGIVHYSNGPVVRTVRTYDALHPFESVILALDTFKDSALLAAPGERFSYTTHGYILLSAVVERAGKQPFAEQVAERIAKPARMTQLAPDYQWKPIPHRAVGYRMEKAGDAPPSVVRSTDTDVSWKLGGGGYVSAVRDMARYAAALARGELLSDASREAMWKPALTASQQPTSYGLGFQILGDAGDRRIAHGGSQEKTRTYLMIHPATRNGVVVLSNSEYADPQSIASRLFDELLAMEQAGQ